MKIKVEVATPHGHEVWEFNQSNVRKEVQPLSFKAYANNPRPYKNPLEMYIDLKNIREKIPESIVALLTKNIGRKCYEFKGRIKY